MITKPAELSARHKRFICALPLLLILSVAFAQTTLPLTDLSFFKSPSANWRTGGDVNADLNSTGRLTYTNGTGILVNTFTDESARADLFSAEEYGDVDIELDYMMAKGSNSGIYLSGRYEIQLLDSWGILKPKSSDNGGIYERWNDSTAAAQKGFEGHAPRQNVSKAPGLWQHLRISFQAPRFTNAVKTENAKMLRVELNGVVIHENVELFGPTRNGLNDEKPKGPLRLQGDHGPVAFRNIKITSFDKAKPRLSNLQYAVYKGPFNKQPDYAKLKPVIKGSSETLTTNINNLPDSFILRYTGKLTVDEAGEYHFNLFTVAGRGSLVINNQQLSIARGRNPVKISLPAGELPFELSYFKTMDWGQPALGLTVAGPGIRDYTLSDMNNLSSEQTDPILVDAPVNTVLRSFIDIPTIRVVHAVSVGSPEGLHYTYDMDNGAIVQVWRGGFLDATPMWHDRGDGSSRATGSKQLFGKPVLNIGKLASANSPWKTDTSGTGFRPKGYELDEKDRPVFQYFIYGNAVKDASQVLENRQGISREISVLNPSENLYVRLAASKNIEDLGNGLYLLDDKSYYLKIEDGSEAKPMVRDAGEKKELVIPIKNKIKYIILF
ncbi:family 16 glycoside hydrolase [Terrimonas pollutisoli]|uniref:family 16 glycoside hydrolase n=1 Tax=Terrimonas pollutisoli TaxID=3034147 RepID=UPI0023ED3547|nr:family 16 glycoside hydrolase [Terrimonas sp. H1YJ31]